MPHDPKITGVTFENGRFYIQQYEAPAETDENDNYVQANDPFKEKDIELPKTMMGWLDKHFPMGGRWKTESDARQGVVWFRLPALMGDMAWRINLHTDDIVEAMDKGAGEICERYNLPRGRWDPERYAEALAKHARLALPFRTVPS